MNAAPSRAVAADRDRVSRIFDLATQLDTWPLAMDALQRGLSFSEFEAKALQRYRRRELGFKLGRLFEHAEDPARLDGFEREQADEWNRAASPNEMVPPGRYHLPWSELASRDMTAAGVSGSGYLVATESMEPADILRPYSVTARAGITIASGLQGNQVAPVTTANPTINWLSTENTAGTPSQPTVGQVAATPKIATGLVTHTRQIAKQANAEPFLRSSLARTAATAIDQAVLAGTGISGQPTGIVNSAGIGTTTGTSMDRDDPIDMRDGVAAANAPDDQIKFIGSVDVRTTLSKRAVGTDTGRYVWQGDMLADRPALVSTNMPAATLIAGAWSTAVLCLWGDGIVLDVDPYSGFRTGVLTARVLISCDNLLLHPAAFDVATGVS